VPTPGGNPHELIGDLMLVLAGAAWAATTLLVKATRLVRVSYEKTLLYQLIVSAPMLALCAQAAGERVVGTPSAVALASLLYQTGWVVAVTFLAWFALIQRYSASRLSVFTLPDPAIRDRGRPPGAGRSPDPGLRARRCAGGGGPRIGEPATLTPQAQSGTSPGAFFPASACPF
jgi:hypothetical protein